MKVYLIGHSFNEINSLTNYHEIVGVYSTKEKAEEVLEGIADSIERGVSAMFPNERIKREEINLFTGIKDYIFPWIGEDGKQMFTHLTMREMELDK